MNSKDIINIPRGKKLAIMAANVNQKLGHDSGNSLKLQSESEPPMNSTTLNVEKKTRKNDASENYEGILKYFLASQSITKCYFFIEVHSHEINFELLREQFLETEKVSDFIRKILNGIVTIAIDISELDINKIPILDEDFQPLVLPDNVEDVSIEIVIDINENTTNNNNTSSVNEENSLLLLNKTETNNDENLNGENNDEDTTTMLLEADVFLTDTTNTKSGNKRKRQKYLKPKHERTQFLVEKKRQRHVVKLPCDQCKKACTTKINEERRKELNNYYWNLNLKEQRLFISNHCEVKVIERRRSEKGNDSKRQNSICYKLKDENKAVQCVCKKFFLTTLGFAFNNDSVLKNISDEKFYTKNDQRGAKTKEKKINRDLLHTHIKSFSPCVSHYRREHAPNKLYLPSDITITQMHKDFLDKHPNIQVSYEVYRKEVTDTINISFTRLGQEECEKCEAFRLHNSEHTKQNLHLPDCEKCVKWNEHIQKAKISRGEYRKDCENQQCKNPIYSADMQKVIMLPRIEMFKSAIFTTRIIAFNESFVPVGDMKKNPPYIVLWHEGISGRKREDVASTFYQFFLFNRDAAEVTLWLDNCAGQNKNWCLFSMLISIISSKEICTNTITLKYFEAGHTFMSADSFHHQVELALKKNPKVYDFQDFVNIVRDCNSKKNIIKEMRHSDFRNFLDLTSAYQLQKLNKTNERPLLKDICLVKVKRGYRHLFYKTHFSEQEEKEFHFISSKYKKNELPVAEASSANRGITTNRKKAIINNLSDIIPAHKLEFWKNMPVNDDAANLITDIEDL